jgi:hypothetical protein
LGAASIVRGLQPADDPEDCRAHKLARNKEARQARLRLRVRVPGAAGAPTTSALVAFVVIFFIAFLSSQPAGT